MGQESNRAEHLRRFRGGALVVLVLQSFAIAAGSFMLSNGAAAEAETARATLIGAALVIIPALMVWNGSLLGGAFLVLVMAAELALSFTFGGGPSWPLVRSAFYLSLSIWIFVELVRYRRKTRRAGENIGGSAILRWTGASIMAASMGIVVLGVTSELVPEPTANDVLTARQISGEQYRWMYENQILGHAERVFLFSSDAGLPYSDGGNLLTNRSISGWWRKEDGDLDSGWIKLGEICSIEETSTADDVEETLYTIRTYGADSWLRILLPKKDGADRRFLARMNYLNNQKMHSEIRSACDEAREPDWDEIAKSNGISRSIIGPEEIDPDHLTWMRHHDYLTHKEEVINFYSSGNYSIASGGLLLTDAYFGGWAEDKNGLQGWWFKHGEICTVKKEKNATKTYGPLYKVESADNWFQFHIPDEGKQDERFIAEIERRNSAAQTKEQVVACEKMLKDKIGALKTEIEDASN